MGVHTTKGILLNMGKGSGSSLWGAGGGGGGGAGEEGNIQEKHAMGGWNNLRVVLQERHAGDC